MWPERIKTRGPYGSTASIDYSYRPYASTTVYGGMTSVNANGLGSSQLVFDTKKSRWHPGTLKLSRVQMRKTTQTATDDFYVWDPKGTYPHPKIWLKGPIAGMYLSAIPDPTFLGMGTCWDQLLADSSLIEAYARWGQPSADVGVMVGEAAETLRFLSKPLSSFVSIATKMYNVAVSTRRTSRSRRMAQQGSHLMSILSDLWMSGRYGLLPLMSDIDSLMKFVDKQFDKADVPFYRVSGSGSMQRSSKSLQTRRVLILDFTWEVEVDTTVKASSRVFYKPSWWYLGRMRTLEQLGLDPFMLPNTLYQIIPLSFVVDWGIDIGSWIQAHRPRPGYVYMGNCVSCKTTRTTTWTNVRVKSTYASYPDAPLTSSKGFSVDETLDRQVNLPLPLTPQIGNGLSSLARGVDALSLTWQRMPKLLSKR